MIKNKPKKQKKSKTSVFRGVASSFGKRINPERPLPFSLPEFPPGVAPKLPKDDPTYAADEDISQIYGWANTDSMLVQGQNAWDDGMMFMGYPYLALLSQRSEYRRPVEIIAAYMTSAWIQIVNVGQKDKTKKIKQLNDAIDKFKLKHIFRRACEQDGFMGRSHIYIDLGNDSDAELLTSIGNGRDKVSVVKVGTGKLKGFKNIEAPWVYPQDYNASRPLKPDWYNPQSWQVMGQKIHSTRLLTFVGREVADILKPSYAFGGLALTQMLKPYVDNWLRARQSVSNLIHSFSVMNLQTDMQSMLNESSNDLVARVDLFNASRDNRGLMLTNFGSEELKNISVPLSTLDDLLAMSQEQMSAVPGIPLIILFGITPKGLNATADPEIRIFLQWIAAFQELLFQVNLTKAIDIIQLSEFGEIDQDLLVRFEPIKWMTPKEMAEVQKLNSETDVNYIEAGSLSAEESRERLAADSNNNYSSIDVSKIPETPAIRLMKEQAKLNPQDKDDDPEENINNKIKKKPKKPIKKK